MKGKLHYIERDLDTQESAIMDVVLGCEYLCHEAVSDSKPIFDWDDLDIEF